jgi:hypothetical protein
MSWDWKEHVDQVVADLCKAPTEPPISEVQHQARDAMSNVETLESTIAHFERSTVDSWNPSESRVLRESRRRLVIKAAGSLVVYWMALCNEEKRSVKRTQTGD